MNAGGHRRQVTAAIVALVVLVGLLGYVIGRNYQRDRGRRAQDSSDFVQQERAAIRETKTAFAEVYSNGVIQPAAPVFDVADPMAPPRSASPPIPIIKPRNGAIGDQRIPAKRPGAASGKSNAARHSSDVAATLSNRSAQTAVRRWTELANSPLARPSVCRRLGITLFLFHRPGGMEVFRRIPLLPPLKSQTKERSAALAARSAPAAAQSPLTFKEEGRLWDSIYGPKAPNPSEAPALRAKLAKLNLGWFENVAAATLGASREACKTQPGLVRECCRRNTLQSRRHVHRSRFRDTAGARLS
jgi:hypothetical protein